MAFWCFVLLITLCGATLDENQNKQINKGCVLFHVQHKNAGMAVLAKLKASPHHTCEMNSWRSSCVASVVNNCDEDARCLACEIFWGIIGDENKIYESNRAPIIAEMDGNNMDNSTCPTPEQTLVLSMFRDPIARLASATYYCHFHYGDPLCTSGEREWIEKATVLDMAKVQGNLVFREFLLHPLINSKVQLGPSTRPFNPVKKFPKAKPYLFWEEWRDVLAEGGDPTSVEGAANLNLVLTAMKSDEFAIGFGILERWSDTMELFECLAPLATSKSITGDNKAWTFPSPINKRTDHGSAKWRNDEMEALANARKDPQVLSLLAADIQIYNVLVESFERRLSQIKDGKIICAQT